MSEHQPLHELIAQKQDNPIEQWLRQKVARAYDAMKANPERGIPAEQVFAEIRALHAQQLKDGT